MTSAIVDTNLFVSAVISEIGAPRRLLNHFRLRRFTLILSSEQLADIMDVFNRPQLIARFKLPPEDILELTDLFKGTVARDVTFAASPIAVRDVKDEHLLSVAFGSRADYLVTGDNDLLSLRNDPRLGQLHIVTAAEFLDVLDAAID